MTRHWQNYLAKLFASLLMESKWFENRLRRKVGIFRSLLYQMVADLCKTAQLDGNGWFNQKNSSATSHKKKNAVTLTQFAGFLFLVEFFLLVKIPKSFIKTQKKCPPLR